MSEIIKEANVLLERIEREERERGAAHDSYAAAKHVLDAALKLGATHVTLDTSEADELKVPLEDALEGWDIVAPGELFRVRGIHWEDACKEGR